MNIIRIFSASVAVTLFISLLHWLVDIKLFSWVYTIPPTNMWKPSSEYYSTFLLYMITFAIIFVWVTAYAHFNSIMPGKNKLTKGLIFGFFVWGVSTLPPIFLVYTYLNIPHVVVFFWLFTSVIKIPIYGALTAAIIGE